MVTRTFQRFVHFHMLKQWNTRPALYYGSRENRSNFMLSRDFYGGNRDIQLKDYDKKKLDFFEHGTTCLIQRSFSTSHHHNSVSKRLAKMYARRDFLQHKRKEFFEKFSAARFVNAAPESLKPYLEIARVDKPIGTWLLYLPCTFGICLATPPGSLPDFYYLGLFGIGAFLMRGAGCVINDLWDKDLDKHVERTKSRPLASGKLKTRNAIAFLGVQLSPSLAILLSLNYTCIVIGVASMIPVIFYPLAKRVTYFPQAVLGLTFNIGAIMGYTAVTGYIDWATVLPLYAGCFLWTMYYDTIYAVQDAEDDVKIGIRSTALLFLASKDIEELNKMPVGERLQEMEGSRIKLQRSLVGTYLMTMVLWISAIFNAGASAIAYFVPAVNLVKVSRHDHSVRTRKECWERFVGSRDLGLLVLCGIILGVYLQQPEEKSKSTN